MRALGWLALLGPLFFVTYNWSNAWASRLPYVPSIAFEWERALPFLAWTIVPYWSSDLLYAGSLFLCRSRAELDRHALRLLAIQLFSVACFVLFPLKATWIRPAVDGVPGWLFASLESFDRPFNQAPSLHVSLAVLLWPVYRRYIGWAGAAWFILMALSAWTTWQHQFIDLPLGAWAGLLVLALVPERRFEESRRPMLALLYLTAACALTAAAFEWRIWLALWPAFALSMVACAYWTGDDAWLAKRNGRIAFWMWPYTLGAWVNSRLWTRGEEPWHSLAEGVWIGRAPSPGATPFAAVLDLTAEMPVRADAHVPVLDLTAPRAEQIAAALAAIERLPRPLLVCCALGYSRSAAVGAAWLVAAGHAATLDEAAEHVRRARPQVVLRKEALRHAGV